jgi:hypothetical protein
LDGSVHSVKKKAEAIVVASKEARIEANANKTKYIVMSRDQSAEISHNIDIDHSSFERT